MKIIEIQTRDAEYIPRGNSGKKKKENSKARKRSKSGALAEVKRGREATPRSSFPRFSLVFQVQRSVTSLMTLLSTQYKTPRHPSLQIEPIHRILIPRVILSVPTPQFHVYALFQICSRCLSYEFHAAPVRVIPHSLAKICSIFDTKEKKWKNERFNSNIVINSNDRDLKSKTLKVTFGTN